MDRVSKPFIAIEKDRFSGDGVIAEPRWLGKLPIDQAKLGTLPSPFAAGPACLEIPNQQTKERRIPTCERVPLIDCDGWSKLEKASSKRRNSESASPRLTRASGMLLVIQNLRTKPSW